MSGHGNLEQLAWVLILLLFFVVFLRHLGVVI
jgi:hypothetical protein